MSETITKLIDAIGQLRELDVEPQEFQISQGLYDEIRRAIPTHYATSFLGPPMFMGVRLRVKASLSNCAQCGSPAIFECRYGGAWGVVCRGCPESRSGATQGGAAATWNSSQEATRRARS